MGLRVGTGGFAIIGHGIQQAGLSHALALVIDDHPCGGLAALEADLDGSVREMTRCLKAQRFEGEGIVGAHLALLLHENSSSLASLGGRKRTHLRSRAKRSRGDMPRTEWVWAL
jgi:hypothetical protein